MIAATLGLILLGSSISEGIKADLNSPSYAVRQKAEEQLRATFVPTDHQRWDQIAAHFRRLIGKPVAEVVTAAQGDGIPLAIVDNPSLPFASRLILDDDWVLECHFQDGTLRDADLFLEPTILPIDPPANYTGLWRYYRANGALAENTYYSKGTKCGPLNDGAPIVRPLPPVQSSYPIVTTRLQR